MGSHSKQPITAERQLSRIDYNVFGGYASTGAPGLSCGRIAEKHGKLRAERGDGRYIERRAFSPVHVANSTWKTQAAPKRIERARIAP